MQFDTFYLSTFLFTAWTNVLLATSAYPLFQGETQRALTPEGRRTQAQHTLAPKRRVKKNGPSIPDVLARTAPRRPTSRLHATVLFPSVAAPEKALLKLFGTSRLDTRSCVYMEIVDALHPRCKRVEQ